MTATLDSVEAELAAAHEAAELHREVVRFMVSEVARLRREADQARACEAAALGLLPDLRARLAESEAGRALELSRAREAESLAMSKTHQILASEARLSAATRVVEAAALAAVPLEALRLAGRDELSAEVKLAIITATDALRAALREWKEGSKPTSPPAPDEGTRQTWATIHSQGHRAGAEWMREQAVGVIRASRLATMYRKRRAIYERMEHQILRLPVSPPAPEVTKP